MKITKDEINTIRANGIKSIDIDEKYKDIIDIILKCNGYCFYSGEYINVSNGWKLIKENEIIIVDDLLIFKNDDLFEIFCMKNEYYDNKIFQFKDIKFKVDKYNKYCNDDGYQDVLHHYSRICENSEYENDTIKAEKEYEFIKFLENDRYIEVVN